MRLMRAILAMALHYRLGGANGHCNISGLKIVALRMVALEEAHDKGREP